MANIKCRKRRLRSLRHPARENRTVSLCLPFDHTECQWNLNQLYRNHKGNRIKVNTRVRKMSSARDTGCFVGAPLGTIEGARDDQSVHYPPLCAHLFPTFKWFSPLLLPSLNLVASLVPSQPVTALLSLPGSPFPFQLTCCVTRSFLWRGKGEKEGTSNTLCLLSTVSFFPFYARVLILFFYALLPFTDLSCCC